ncbi:MULTISPECIES: ROK family protein [unclassified Leptolyngbya]|uniref:ROK family protein n=1 Tax=unclassified Leptolyngbya TaxID=2650499 RepID=UPI0016873E40|nr:MULTISPECIES: ROK family protein [unclassified Leptolyngbya]MBD1911001.1 ROK family protein [Leptolyngbya sp. FACHB-8]MBD2158332.1 ROK family protein [Leptolyngbya sp. FACHB-16]
MALNTSEPLKTLAVDIGGSGIKVMVLDEKGEPMTARDRLDTPVLPTPEAVLDIILTLATDKTFDRVSVGFPGVIRVGVTETAANLHPSWIGFNLQGALQEKLGKPVRVANDADLQGLGVVAGQGLELVITLGTGFGSALFIQGILVPNLELGHHPFRKGETYEQQLGRAALETAGKKKWQERLNKAIAQLAHTFNYDYLYIGGGNAKEIKMELPPRVKIVPNIAGLLGGIALWRGEV